MKIRTFTAAWIIFFLTLVPAFGQMVEGTDIPEFGQTFGVDVKRKAFEVETYLIESSIPGNVLWPDDQARFTLQVVNHKAKPVRVKGRLEVIAYGTVGRPGDIWTPQMFKKADAGFVPFETAIAPGGFRNITLQPGIPATFGAYGLVADMGSFGRQFITSCIRTFASGTQKLQYPSFCLDDISNDVLQRLGVQAIRHGIDYKPTTDPDFEEWYQAESRRLKAYQQANIAVLVKMGAPEAYGKIHPMGVPRPWLDGKGVMKNTKTDMAWMPAYDEDFKKLCYRLATDFGWPKGPVNAFSLWNEPWEGISISGWGADMPRYREIYTKLAEAVEEARRDGGVDVLVGGTSSTSNALDKLFADGTDAFLDRFDFCSIHYQGMSSSATIKKWVDRQSPRGRVKIWDTESWVANTDDRVAAVVATNRAAGYDRAMGIYRGNICHVVPQTVRQADGKKQRTEITHAWSVAASIGATQHFIGERKFREILFKNGLPWVMVFDGLPGKSGTENMDDGTLVVVGDIGEAFGAQHVLFRTARGLKETARKEAIRKRLSALDPATGSAEIARLNKEIQQYETLSGASLTLDANKGTFRLYDFYGNPVAPVNGKITVPLDGRGFFLRTDGSAGSFKQLIGAVRQSYVEGIEPLETVAYDLLSPISAKPELKLKLTNVLNRPLKGTLSLTLGNLALDKRTVFLSFRAHETKEIKVKVSSGNAASNNTYPLNLLFDAGADGQAIHSEDIHVNLVAKRKIQVDGKLDDWQGVLPQTVTADQTAAASLTEAAWFPFKQFEQTVTPGFSNGYLAYDEKYFYFAAKVADNSPDEGMLRFETRNDDEFFYPEKSYIHYDAFRYQGAMKHQGISFSARWTGRLKAKYSEEYTLSLLSPNPVRLWLNGKLLIDKWQGPEKEAYEARLKLEAGKLYTLQVELSKEGTDAAVQLLWESKRQAKEVIPGAYLFSGPSGKAKSGNGLQASYYNGPRFNVLRVSRVDEKLDFTWAKGAVPDSAFIQIPLLEMQWPEGVRRYSYRRDPELPSGNFPNHDNVQIAFNVLSADEKELYPYPSGTMPGFTNYQCTDYEYALNPVAPMYGGGVEIWRLKVPGMPHKHFFPRQGASPADGPVKTGKLSVVREGNTRIVEVAIPWAEIPHVKQCLDKGQTIKFSFRVNDNTGNGCMELARQRSVSKINGSFKVDWKEHWANELEFSFER